MIKQIAVAIALAFAPVAFAQTYIVPDGDCGAVTLHVTRGTDFPNLGETIGADRVKDARLAGVRPSNRLAGVRPSILPPDVNNQRDGIGVRKASARRDQAAERRNVERLPPS